MALGFNNNRHHTIKAAKQSKPTKNFDSIQKQKSQSKLNKAGRPKKINHDSDTTPVTTMKVNRDSLMKLSAIQRIFELDTRTEAFNTIMNDIVPYYIKAHKINKSTYNILYKLLMKK